MLSKYSDIIYLDITKSLLYVDMLHVCNVSLLQCFFVLRDVLVKIELHECIPLARESNVLSTGKKLICLSLPSGLRFAVRFCSLYKKSISFSAVVC